MPALKPTLEVKWLIFDATRLGHLNGLVRIGNSRDAAVASIFGRVRTTKMKLR